MPDNLINNTVDEGGESERWEGEPPDIEGDLGSKYLSFMARHNVTHAGSQTAWDFMVQNCEEFVSLQKDGGIKSYATLRRRMQAFHPTTYLTYKARNPDTQVVTTVKNVTVINPKAHKLEAKWIFSEIGKIKVGLN